MPADDDENDEAQAMDAEDTPQADTADDCKTRPEEDADGMVRHRDLTTRPVRAGTSDIHSCETITFVTCRYIDALVPKS